MRPRQRLFALLVTVLAAMSSWPPASQAQRIREKVVLVFCDVTSSLDPAERKAVADLTARILQNLKPPVRYQVVPILLETEAVAPLMSEEIPALVKPSDKTRYQKTLALLPDYLDRKIATLHTQANGPGKDPNRSCIINSLERATVIFDQHRARPDVDLHLIVVSDMLEECAQSPYGALIRLNKTDIAKEIEMVKKPASVGRLAGVRVALVVPAGETYKPNYVHPPMRELGKFWRAVFQQAGLGEKQLNDPGSFYFGPGLPERLRKPW